jgi:SAM-dependent methyltransferase
MNETVPAWIYQDNGFSSLIAMFKSHEPMLNAAETVLTDEVGNILDLGCGNGWLLATLSKRFTRRLTPFGIDQVAARIERARQLNAGDDSRFRVGDLFSAPSLWPTTRFDLTFLMAGRLHDQPYAKVAPLLAYLKSNTTNLLLYAYDDWIERWGDISQIAQLVCPDIKLGVQTSNVALATLSP